MYDYKTSSYNCTILEEAWFTYILPIVPGNTYLSYEAGQSSSSYAYRWFPANEPGNYSVDKTFTRDIYRDEWRYQDPVYTYYYYRDLHNQEKNYDPSGEPNVSNVVKYVKYREK